MHPVVRPLKPALVQRLVNQCIKDGAVEQEAEENVRTLLRLVIRLATEHIPAPFNAEDKKALEKLSKSLEETAVLMDETNSIYGEFLSIIDPAKHLFPENGTPVTRTELSSHLRVYAHAIKVEIGRIELHRGRPTPERLGNLAELTATKWREATGIWPALTRSVDDSEPVHELFLCLPIIVSQLQAPHSLLGERFTQRAFFDAMSKFIKLQSTNKS